MGVTQACNIQSSNKLKIAPAEIFDKLFFCWGSVKTFLSFTEYLKCLI